LLNLVAAADLYEADMHDPEIELMTVSLRNDEDGTNAPVIAVQKMTLIAFGSATPDAVVPGSVTEDFILVEIDTLTAPPIALDMIAYGGPADIDDDFYPVPNNGTQIDLATMLNNGVVTDDFVGRILS